MTSPGPTGLVLFPLGTYMCFVGLGVQHKAESSSLGMRAGTSEAPLPAVSLCVGAHTANLSTASGSQWPSLVPASRAVSSETATPSSSSGTLPPIPLKLFCSFPPKSTSELESRRISGELGKSQACGRQRQKGRRGAEEPGKGSGLESRHLPQQSVHPRNHPVFTKGHPALP